MANYFVSFSTGNDGNAGTQASPFKTITKVNSLLTNPGDIVSFMRGDRWDGIALSITRSGGSGNPITYNAYTGSAGNAKPIISGLVNAAGWAQTGNIWRSAMVSGGQTTSMIVTVNGVSVPMGKWPNGTNTTSANYWRVMGSASGSSITDSVGAVPFNPAPAGGQPGATVVIRKNQYSIQNGTVTSQSGSTINYTPFPSTTQYTASAGWGYFIQNHIGTLDSQNEWWWDGVNKQLVIYSTSSPANIKVATVTSTVILTNRSWITFNNISVQGSIYDLVTANSASNIVFDACDLDAAGNSALYIGNSGNITFQNGTISNSNNFGILGGNASATGNIVLNNTISNTGVYPGMTDQSGGHSLVESCVGALVWGGCTIRLNNISNSGYSAIFFKGSNVLIENNFINGACVTKDEGAAIYSFVGQADSTNFTNQRVNANIIINSIGNSAGKNGSNTDAKGIYLDINVRNTQLTNNSIAHCGGFAILLQDGVNNTVTGNNCYDSTKNLGSSIDAPLFAMWSDTLGTSFNRQITVTNNIFTQRLRQVTVNAFNVVYIQSNETTINPEFTAYNNNVVASPISPNTPANTVMYYTQLGTSPVVFAHRTLSSFQSGTGLESGTTPGPATLSNNQADDSKIRFEYNATSATVNRGIGTGYINMKGISQPSTISIPAYSSVTLLLTGAPSNIPPTANAGPDKVITLPTNSTSLVGSGSDSDGTISSYLWTKTAGPATFTINSPNSSTTTVSNLVQGVYTFQLQVTDNGGATGTDTVLVTVNSAGNIAPVANAGSNQTITLPTNSVTLNGSASTDSDGTITAYLWSKVSGPASGTISNPNAVSTTVTNLVQGTYVFQLQVTDNSGGTGVDTVSITVNSGSNIPPTSNAGTDKVITLPTNSVSQTGSGNDPDGSIVNYLWKQNSGPSTATITSPSTPVTSFSNLVQGVYVFDLEVTDNQGAFGHDQCQITVNSTSNIPPSVNAGVDKIIRRPTSSSTFAGSASDSDGTISSHTWSFVSGPGSTPTITTPSSYTSPVTGMTTLGIYTFRLTAVDNSGASVSDTMTITVKKKIRNSGSIIG